MWEEGLKCPPTRFGLLQRSDVVAGVPSQGNYEDAADIGIAQ